MKTQETNGEIFINIENFKNYLAEQGDKYKPSTIENYAWRVQNMRKKGYNSYINALKRFKEFKLSLIMLFLLIIVSFSFGYDEKRIICREKEFAAEAAYYNYKIAKEELQELEKCYEECGEECGCSVKLLRNAEYIVELKRERKNIERRKCFDSECLCIRLFWWED